MLHDDPTLAASRPGQILIADKNYYGRDFETDLSSQGIHLLRRARKGEPERPAGVLVRVLMLALTTAIWHNDRTGQPVRRSLIVYDH